MTRDERIGKIQTVLGIIDPDSLGITLPHEHLLIDMAPWFNEPVEASEKGIAHEPIKLENLWWVKTHATNHVSNTRMDDEELAVKESLMFRQAGGSTIVDLTCIGLARDPLALSRISVTTGLNIIMGSGYYIRASHPCGLDEMTLNEIADKIVSEVVEGVGDTGVHAGIIGEIGCSVPLHETERKVIRAAIVAQKRTGAALNIHPSPDEALVLEIIEILRDEGADLSRTVISHVDQWGFCLSDTWQKIAEAGCYIEFDSFGNEGIFLDQQTNTLVQYAHDDVLLIKQIKQLIAQGYLNQLLISCDICYKHMLVAYGGYGYAHIPRSIVPVMRWAGISQENIDTLLTENPKRLLTFATPVE